MPNATAVIGSRTRLRDGSNRVLAMITKGSMTGSLISANQLPPMTRGISNEPTTIAAIGKRISGASFNERVTMAMPRNESTSGARNASNGAGTNPKTNGENRA